MNTSFALFRILRYSAPLLVLLACSGCARIYHQVHYGPLGQHLSERHRTYYHSPDTGRIISKGTADCVTEPACFGYNPTCWAPWPTECVNCPPPEVTVEVVREPSPAMLHEVPGPGPQSSSTPFNRPPEAPALDRPEPTSPPPPPRGAAPAAAEEGSSAIDFPAPDRGAERLDKVGPLREYVKALTQQALTLPPEPVEAVQEEPVAVQPQEAPVAVPADEDPSPQPLRSSRRNAAERFAESSSVPQVDTIPTPSTSELTAATPKPQTAKPEAVEPKAVEPKAIEPEAVEPEAVEIIELTANEPDGTDLGPPALADTAHQPITTTDVKPAPRESLTTASRSPDTNSLIILTDDAASQPGREITKYPTPAAPVADSNLPSALRWNSTNRADSLVANLPETLPNTSAGTPGRPQNHGLFDRLPAPPAARVTAVESVARSQVIRVSQRGSASIRFASDAVTEAIPGGDNAQTQPQAPLRIVPSGAATRTDGGNSSGRAEIRFRD